MENNTPPDDEMIEKVAHDFVSDVIDSASNSLVASGESCQKQQVKKVQGLPTTESYETPSSSKRIYNGKGYHNAQVDQCHSSDEENESFDSTNFNNFSANSLPQTNTSDPQQRLVKEPAFKNPDKEFLKNNGSAVNGLDVEDIDSNASLNHSKHPEASGSTTADKTLNSAEQGLFDALHSNDNEEVNENVKETTQPDVDKNKTQSQVDEWLDVLGNGLLKKKVASPGLGSDSRPLRSQEVTISVESKFADGTVAEDSQELTFVLAEQDVLDALDLAVNLMEKEETCTIVANSKYCYGKKGKLPNIPPDTDLTFTVKLLDIQGGPYDISTPIAKRLAWVDDRRSKGNKLYSEKSFKEALHAYRKCARILEQASNQEHSEDIKKEITSYMVKCHNNLSASHMMLEEWKDALQACQRAEKLDPTNVKTVFRKGKTLAKLGEMKKAVETLKKADQLCPDDKAIQAELTRLTKKMQTQKEAQQKMYKRMFWGKDNKEAETKTDQPGPPPGSSWMPNFNVMAGSALIAVGAVLLGAYFLQK